MRFILFALCVNSLALAAPKGPNAQAILKEVDRWRTPGGSFSFVVKVDDIEEKQKVRETEYQVFSKGDNLARIETVAPERLKGRKLLMRDNDLWLYLPSIKRPTRVSFQQRLTGEVANGDIARINFSDDYVAKTDGTAKHNGHTYLKLVLKARHEEVTYRKISLLVDAKTYRPFRVNFYALSGKLLKTGEYSQPVKVFDHEVLSRFLIQDAVQTDRQSLLHYSRYQREKLDDSFFNKESLP